MKIIVFANSVYTNTLTGGDRIFAESVKHWIKIGHDVVIVTNEAGLAFCKQTGLSKKNIVVWSTSWADKFGVYVSMLVKAIICSIYGLGYKVEKPDVVFASSFFSPDIVPALILKLKNPSSKLSTAFYLFSTKKWGQDYSGGKAKGVLFYLNEVIAFYIMKKYGDSIVTASKHDRTRFIKAHNFSSKNVLAIRGGVDSQFFASIPTQTTLFDAIFVGRLHPQKCLDDLIDIWEKVVEKRPQSKLAIIGTGPSEPVLIRLVEQKKLTANIFFLGPQDGVKKTKLIKSSRIFVSASLFDSGNIALDESLSCGVPGIIYDLEQLDYSKGVIKVDPKNQKMFVEAILFLLDNKKRLEKLADEAVAFALKLNWEIKAKILLDFISK